jgi:hypothetical protein
MIEFFKGPENSSIAAVERLAAITDLRFETVPQPVSQGTGMLSQTPQAL